MLGDFNLLTNDTQDYFYLRRDDISIVSKNTEIYNFAQVDWFFLLTVVTKDKKEKHILSNLSSQSVA